MIIAGIVTYNPDLELLSNELNELRNQCIKVVVVDNYSENIQAISDIISEMNGVFLFKNEENRGIAAALNQVFVFAIKNNAKWVLTLDQDSHVFQNIAGLLESNTNSKKGIIAPKIVYEGKTNAKNKCIQNIESKEWVITSGSLTNVEAWRVIGGFDEKMFIDFVDYDFCFRLRKNGFSVVQNNSVLMRHHLGELEERHFLFWKINVGHHSSLRKYYMSRNCFYLRKKKEVSSFWCVKRFWSLILESLYEDNKRQKIRAIFRGRKDAKKMAL